MRVYRCDRCGRFFKRGELFVMVPPNRPIFSNFKIKKHICRDCSDSFYRWWREPNRSENTATYSEVTPNLLRSYCETRCEMTRRGFWCSLQSDFRGNHGKRSYQ